VVGRISIKEKIKRGGQAYKVEDLQAEQRGGRLSEEVGSNRVIQEEQVVRGRGVGEDGDYRGKSGG